MPRSGQQGLRKFRLGYGGRGIGAEKPGQKCRTGAVGKRLAGEAGLFFTETVIDRNDAVRGVRIA